MKHKPITAAEALQHIRAVRPKLAQALAAISGDDPTAHDMQACMGQIMSASRAAAEYVSYLRARRNVEQAWYAVSSTLCEKTKEPIHPDVWHALDWLKRLMHDANHRANRFAILHEAELAFLRPLAWRNEEWIWGARGH